jgi:hypothetical protein
VPAPPDEVFEHSGFDTLRAALTAFARASRGGKACPVPLEDVLHGMAVFDARSNRQKPATLAPFQTHDCDSDSVKAA